MKNDVRSKQLRETYKEWGQALALQRNKRNWSKRRAAKEIGVSEGTWRMYEAGGRTVYGTWVLPNPSADVLRRITRVFGIVLEIGDERTEVRTADPDEMGTPAASEADLTGINLGEVRRQLEAALETVAELERRQYE